MPAKCQFSCKTINQTVGLDPNLFNEIENSKTGFLTKLRHSYMKITIRGSTVGSPNLDIRGI